MAIFNVLKSFNIEIMKYLDQFPFIAQYFDGKNRITPKNNILFHLIYWLNQKYYEKITKNF